MDLKNILELHLKYLQGSADGSRADLSCADLSDADLSRADLSCADLSCANLSDANLRGADLSRANLRGADLSRANLRDADLSGANLSGANLRGANLRGADLSRANLSDANLRGADLRGADLSDANLSRAKNLLSSTAWMLSVFKTNKHGVIVYKAQNAQYESPKHWDWSPGKYLTEVPNLLPTVECGCGVNFATLKWIQKNHSESVIWECLIEWIDLCETVVPYNTDGKARCAKLKLVKQL